MFVVFSLVYLYIERIPYQTGNKIKKKKHFFKSLPANELQRANYFLAFLACGILPHCDFQPWRFATGRLGRFAPHHKSIYHNDLQSQIVWHFAPQGVWHFAPPRHYAPVVFAHFIFLARFSEFWHDFRPEFLLLARYKPLPPNELQSTSILSS